MFLLKKVLFWFIFSLLALANKNNNEFGASLSIFKASLLLIRISLIILVTISLID